MNKMNCVFPFGLLGPAILLFLALLGGCGALPTETRYNDNIRTYTSHPVGVKSTSGMHENVTAYYTLRNRGSSSAAVDQTRGRKKMTASPQQEPEMAMVLEVSDVLFEFDKWVIKEPYLPELDQWAEYLQDNPQVQAEIYGFTDSIGTVRYNQKLSENRAQAVVNYLVEKGVSPKRLTARGFGETQPAAPNDTSEGRQKNRRVELKL